MTVRRKWKVVIIADLKSFPQRKATVVIKFSVSSKHCINEIFFPQGNTLPITTTLNANLFCIVAFNVIYFPDFFSHYNGLVEEWTLHLATKETKASQTIGPAQGSENTDHSKELRYQLSQLCPTFKN